MDTDPAAPPKERKQIGGELVIPVAGILFTIYYFSSIIDSPWTAQVSAFFVGTILIVLSAVFVVRSLLSVVRRRAGLGMGQLLEDRHFIGRRFALLALTLAFIVVIEWGGFTLTTMAFLALAMLLLSGGRKIKLVLALAVSIAIGGWLLFVVAFQTRFPVGPFELLMKQVM